jgi:putative MATE family efflux protein
MTRDFTKGAIAKQIFLFAIPFLIRNLFQQLYSIVDMLIVGRTINSTAYAAVGSTSSIIWFTSGAIQAMTVGFSAVAARFFGANDEEGIKRTFASASKFSALISITLATVCVIFADKILVLIRTPAELFDYAYEYVVWIFAGLLATAFFNLLSNMIRSIGDSRTPLYFLIIACVVNIILDYLFIVVFEMKTAGAGLATVIAQLLSGLLCLVYIVKKHPLLHMRLKHFKLDVKLDLLVLKLGIPMAFLNMVLSVGAIIVQFVTNDFGELYIFAYATGSKIESFLIQPIMSFGSALAVFVSQNLGAMQYKRILTGVWRTILMCCLWCVLAALILLPFGKLIISAIGGKGLTQDMIDYSYRYVLIHTAFTLILTVLVICKSALQAVGRNVFTVISGFTEILARAGVAMLVVYLTSRSILNENDGFSLVCMCNPTAWFVGAVTVLPDYIVMKVKYNKLQREQDSIT